MKGLQPQAGFVLAIIAAGWASHGIWIYYLYLFIMKIRLGTPLLAAAQTLPIVFTGPCFALSTGFLLRKIHVSVVMMIAMLFFLVGTALLAFAPADQSYWALTFISVLIMPGGMNLSFPAGTILLSNLMPKNEQGKAASMVSTVVNYSIATGLGLAGTVERHVHDVGMSELEGYRAAWYMGMGLSAVGIVISAYFFVQSRVEMRQRRAEEEKV
jgi:MFS family permease